jgi:UDPglucose--hexose-1-phosphate uridylyltransferase
VGALRDVGPSGAVVPESREYVCRPERRKCRHSFGRPASSLVGRATRPLSCAHAELPLPRVSALTGESAVPISPSTLFGDDPHRRLNVLTGQWVLVSPHRMKRPWQGRLEEIPAERRPAYDPTCYLCPGNERAGGQRNPQYTGSWAFDNDFAALRAGDTGRTMNTEELLVARQEPGTCRVICFSPRHDLSLPQMEVPAIRGVIDLWAEEYARLGARDDIGHVQIFENKGELMGSSNPHPHGQIWAQQSVPLEPEREGLNLREHHERHRRTLLEDYLRLELEMGERIVCANDAWVALVPFWAVWPFETLVLSRRPVAHLGQLDDHARDLLADVIKQLTARYDALFHVSFPYSAGIHQAPTDGMPHPEWHLHMHFYPPLLRSATVRKFLVGYEMMAEAQRDLTAEAAAARLREVL